MGGQKESIQCTFKHERKTMQFMFACIFVSLFPCCLYCSSCCLATLFHCSSVCLCLFVFVCVRSFVRSFVRLFVGWFVCLFVCLFVRSFVCLFVCSFVCLLFFSLCFYICRSTILFILFLQYFTKGFPFSCLFHFISYVFFMLPSCMATTAGENWERRLKRTTVAAKRQIRLR